MRLGAAFLHDIDDYFDEDYLKKVVAWHPMESGEQILRRMIRGKVVASRFAGEETIGDKEIWEQLVSADEHAAVADVLGVGHHELVEGRERDLEGDRNSDLTASLYLGLEIDIEVCTPTRAGLVTNTVMMTL